MKLNVIDLLVFAIFQIYFMIGLTSSSNFFNLGKKPRLAEYIRLRDASVHRGLFLSLSPKQKNEMCEDFYSAQLYVNSYTEEQIADKRSTIRLISDSYSEKTLNQELSYDLYQRLIVEDLQDTSQMKKDLVMRCFGRHFTKRKASRHLWFHVVYAFHPKWLFSGLRKNSNDKFLTFMTFITLSPDRVPLKQAELETYYVNIARTMKAISEESEEYVDQIKNREVLSTLSEEQKYILCASILSSPVYRDERLEFSFKWMDTNTESLEYVSREVSFKSTIYAEETLQADCILCKAFRHGGWRSSSGPQNLYLTSSYDNEHSLIVLKEEEGHFYVDKHFQNIPILITLGKELDYNGLILNYEYSKNQE